MLSVGYDILLVSDFRFPGGTSSAIAEEIKANAAAGYRTALIHLEAPNLTYPYPINPRIRTLIDAGLADLVDPDQSIHTRLAIAHNPFVLQDLPIRGLNIRAEQRLLVVDQAPLTADGEACYDVDKVRLHADETLDGEVLWAPVGPMVRGQLDRLAVRPPMADTDWPSVIDPAVWSMPRDQLCDELPVIGRHSLPDRRKWPDTREETLAAYPDDTRFLVRVLGGAPFLLELVGGRPHNWRVWGFNAQSPVKFLRQIDFFVYFHHSRWVEAFGCAIMEAMASGAVVILPCHFQSTFGDGALYGQPADVPELVLRYRADRQAYRAQSERARHQVHECFTHGVHAQRLAELIGPSRERSVAVSRNASAALPQARSAPSESRVLFISTNGIGMGHLTRLLAIARRLPPSIEPVFATMSQGLRVVPQMGYLAEYIPHPTHLGCDVNHWNKYLRQEINELIAFYRAGAVVFDSNCPYKGLIDAIGDNPETWFVWCRRGMWRPGSGAAFIEREPHFDAVLEPGDLAGAFDPGLTAQNRERTRMVHPIRLLDGEELLTRDVARQELGLDPERPALLLQLGARNNYDYSILRSLALDHLQGKADLQTVEAEWLISERRVDAPPDALRIQRFPLARWFRAFDMSISAVGYNSFHELIFAGIPTIFVPNENQGQDHQLTRARYAQRHGLGFCLRTRDVYHLAPTLDRLLDPADQEAIAARCTALDATNGAAESAQMIEEMLCIRRADRSRAA